MRIKTQFVIVMIAFIGVLIVITSSVILTNQQINQIFGQEDAAGNIEQGSDALNIISNEYFLYQQNSQITTWQSTYSVIFGNLSLLSPSNPQQKDLMTALEADLNNLNASFGSLTSFLQEQPKNISVRTTPQFQNVWNQMVIQHQNLGVNSSQLSKSLRDEADSLRQTDLVLIVGLVSIFAAFFITTYFLFYRRTLTSISNLQNGTHIVGSGNLDFRIKADSKDEVGDLSRSFNRMTDNLKAVTASKTDLEREISERKRVEQEMAQAKQRLDAHMNNAPEAVIEFDPQFRVTRWSQEAERVFGWTAKEIIGKSIVEMPWVYEDDKQVFAKILADLLNGKNTRGVSHNRNYRKDGTVIECDWYNSAIYDENGNMISILSQVIDVTERIKAEETIARRNKELEELHVKLEEKTAELEAYANRMEELAEERALKLKDAERLAAIGATAGMVGHDIRNPLQAIASDVYLAKSDLSSMPEGEAKEGLKESLNGIDKNVEYINKIVQDLQDYARPLNPKIEESDLKQIVQELLAKNGLPENIKIKVDIPENARIIRTDTYYLNRILSNLISNSIQAMPTGGSLIISSQRKGNDFIITVTDTGVGIPDSIRHKMFTLMFTTKSKGQGFGLPVVKRMTESLGGTVTFDSQEGKGTTFTVRLPPQRA